MKKPQKSKSSKTKKASKPRETQKKKIKKKARKPRESRQKKIKKIIKSIQCSKDFKCYESKFKNLCKAKKMIKGRIIDKNAAAVSRCHPLPSEVTILLIW